MLRALAWKEWKQLGSLRWGSVATGIVLPLLTIPVVRRVAGSGADLSMAVQDFLPIMMCLAVWPLLALMLVVQSLSADRTGGTSSFLIERPIRRRRVWWVRLMAALASMGVVVAAHVLFWWLLTMMVGGRGTTAGGAVAGGALGIGLAVMAGMAAAPFARTQMQGMLLGLVLGAVPFGVGALIARGFVAYRIQQFQLGWLVPLLLVAGYVVVSYTMECRGEPGGRGRIKRGLIALGIAAAAVPLTVAVSAPGVLRLDARLGLGNTSVYPAPSGAHAFVQNLWQGAAWLVDTSTATRTRFFTPDVWYADWNDDGSAIAVMHIGSGMGRSLDTPRIEIVDAATGDPLAGFECETCSNRAHSDGFSWTGNWIVAGALVEGSSGVIVLDATTDQRVEARIPGLAERFLVARKIAGGELRIITMGRRRGKQLFNGESSYRATIYRLDAPRSRLVTEATVDDTGIPYFAADSLSPSGRHWIKMPGYDKENIEVIAIETGDRVDLSALRARWVDDDRLIWVEAGDDDERRVLLGWPGNAREVHRFPGGFIRLAISPDRSHALISRLHRTGATHWILNTTTGEAESFELPRGFLSWADNERIAVVDQGFVGLAGRESPTEVETLLGSRPF